MIHAKTKALVASLLFANILGLSAVSQSLETDSVITNMLARGDSLLQIGKPVGALGMFRSVESRTFDPCTYAQALAGIARVQAYSNNTASAAEAWALAENSCTSCPRSTRTPLVLSIADGWIICNEDDKAAEILEHEWEQTSAESTTLTSASERANLAGALARVSFLQGEWRAAEDWAVTAISLSPDLPTPSWNVLEMQAHILAEGNLPSEVEERFLTATATLDPSAQLALTQQVHTLLVSERLSSEALRWAKRLRGMVKRKDYSAIALAELRLARSAQAAHEPLTAIIAYHEAEQAAKLCRDLGLQAEVYRQSAAFHVGRNDIDHAWMAMQTVDSLNQAMLIALPRPPGDHESNFSQHILAPDPFDRATSEILSARQPILPPGPWMWIAGFLVIGLIAYGLRTRELTRLLQRERNRLVRLRSFVPADRLTPTEVPPSYSSPTQSTKTLGQLSLRPNGELWHTRDGETEAAEVHQFLAQLDRELACEMQWTLPAEMQLSIRPEARVMVRNLLQTFSTIHDTDRAMKIELGRSERDWTIHLTCENTAVSRALSGLFQGKDAAASTRWNELNQQLRLLTAEIVVERLAPGTERLSVTLPA